MLCGIVEVEGGRSVESGCWDSINIVEVQEGAAGQASVYKLTTTIMLHMGVVPKAEVGDTTLAGSLTRQVEYTRYTCMCETFITHIFISSYLYIFISLYLHISPSVEVCALKC
jgi:hypothetical protein